LPFQRLDRELYETGKIFRSFALGFHHLYASICRNIRRIDKVHVIFKDGRKQPFKHCRGQRSQIVFGDGPRVIYPGLQDGAVSKLGLQGAHSFQKDCIGPKGAHQLAAYSWHIDRVFYGTVKKVCHDLFGNVLGHVVLGFPGGSA